MQIANLMHEIEWNIHGCRLTAVFLAVDKGILKRARGRFERFERDPEKKGQKFIEVKDERLIFTHNEFKRGMRNWQDIKQLPIDELKLKKDLILKLSKKRDIFSRLEAAQFAGEWGRETRF